ncbi:MAG: hypothetical protein Q4D39_04325 [Coriobacteriaceae bacterium]|nr:hypothetical protein [Coriobacteriaceae bacterium]
MDENTKMTASELTDEQLDAVSGGLIVQLSGDGCYKYAVVNDETGRILYQNPTLESAKAYSRMFGTSSERVITMDEFERIFGMGLYELANQ